jgi:hypothetical protein
MHARSAVVIVPIVTIAVAGAATMLLLWRTEKLDVRGDTRRSSRERAWRSKANDITP